jgi:hypothetical protein
LIERLIPYSANARRHSEADIDRSKQKRGMVVPTWNYVAIHAYGPAEFFDDADRLLSVVTRLTNLHEGVTRQAMGRHGCAGGLHPRSVAGDRRLAAADHASSRASGK